MASKPFPKWLFWFIPLVVVILGLGGIAYMESRKTGDEAGMLPNSFFYLFDQSSEFVGNITTFTDAKLVDWYISLSNERLAELEALGTDDVEITQNVVTDYNARLDSALTRTSGDELAGKLFRATLDQQAILANLYQNATAEESKTAIESALKKCIQVQADAYEMLSDEAEEAISVELESRISEVYSMLAGLDSTAEEIVGIKELKEAQELTQSTIAQGTAASEEVLVGFKSGTSRSQKDSVHGKKNGHVKKKLDKVNVDVVELPAGTSVQDGIDAYEADSNVSFAEPNYLAQAFAVPNDPYYSSQWGLAKIAAPAAFDLSQGDAIRVAVIDTGVAASHPDLSGVVTTGYNTIAENTNTEDDHGHGTHCAGIVSAKTNNGVGVASVSYRSVIVPVKVLNSSGYGSYSDVAEGIIYASDHGSRVLSMSLGGPSSSETLRLAVVYAQGKGSIIVAAAGNSGNDAPLYPAAYPGVLAVSASDRNDLLATFSSYGSNVFMASPGVSILSTLMGGSYGSMSGTSMATPHISGALSIALAYDPTLTNSELIAALKTTADKVGPYSYNSSGWNQYFGYGRLNTGKLLESLVPTEPEPEPEPEPAPEPEPEPEPNPEPTPTPTKPGERKGHYFDYNITGIIENVNVADSKLTVTIRSGTPEIYEVISGNIAEFIIDEDTTLKYRGKAITLSELAVGYNVSIKGTCADNVLTATDVTMQGKASAMIMWNKLLNAFAGVVAGASDTQP